MKRARFAALMVGLTVVTAAPAGLWESIYRGLDIAATPIGSPILGAGDGTRVNGQRTGRMRIVPNELGHGQRLEFDRTFGLDSRGRPEVFNFGPMKMQLSGNTQLTGEYTGRGFLIATGDVGASNLNYQFSGKSGAQDVVYSGTLNLQSHAEVNVLGFYEYTLSASNSNSSLVADGVVVEDTRNTDFDVGPISVKGNIFVDAVVALLESTGADIDLGPLNERSPVDQITETLQAEFKNAQTTESDRLVGELNAQLIETVLANSSPDAELAGATLLSAITGATSDSNRGLPVPEPSALLLVIGGAALVIGKRRR